MIKPENTADVKIAFAVFFISSIFYIIHTGIYLCTLFLLSHYATAPSLLPASVFLPLMIDSLFLEQLIGYSFLYNYTVF